MYLRPCQTSAMEFFTKNISIVDVYKGLNYASYTSCSHAFKKKSLVNFHRIIWDALRDFVPFVQFEKREKQPWREMFLVKLQASVLIKLTLSLWVFFTYFQIVKILPNRTKYIVRKGVSVPLFFCHPPPFFRNMQPLTPSWHHPSWGKTRFYDDTLESGRLKRTIRTVCLQDWMCAKRYHSDN